jgi:hypothetical protein
MKALNLLIVLLAVTVKVSAQFGTMPAGWMFSSGGTAASRVTIEKGDQLLLSHKRIQVTIIYDGMQVAEYGTEQDFINAMTAHFEAKKPGRGTQWAHEWQNDKNEKFKQLFINKFNELAMESSYAGWVQLDSTAADYQLVITTKSLYAGYEAWITHEPALIDAVCDFRDKSGKTILLVTMENVPGLVFGIGNFDLNLRVGQCYEKLAKDLYKAISKKPKKKKAESSDQ